MPRQQDKVNSVATVVTFLLIDMTWNNPETIVHTESLSVIRSLAGAERLRF